MRKISSLILACFLIWTLPALASVESQILHADRNHYSLRLTLDNDGLEIAPGTGGNQLLLQEGMHEIYAAGDPGLLAYTFVLEIPATSDVICDYSFDSHTVSEVWLMPTRENSESMQAPLITEPNNEVYQADNFFPSEIVTISEPAILRNHRLVQVAVTPYQYNPVTGELLVYSELELDFKFIGENPINQVTRQLPPSPTFEQLLSGNVSNYEQMQTPQLADAGDPGPEPILYIFDTGAAEDMEPLLQWKRQLGHIVYEATEEDMSLTSSGSITNYITDAYEDWDNPPVFVTLVGDPSSCTFGRVVAATSNGDHGYSRIEGNDILGDIFIGRMSVANVSQLEVVINKQLSYEQHPFMTADGWFNSAHLVGDNSQSGMSCVFVNENIRNMMEDHGFGNVTTCYAYQGCTNEVNSIYNAFEDGILFFNYRGYWGMSGWDSSNANSLENYYMLPFVVTITCGSGDYTSQTGITEGFYRAGSMTTPRGGVAAIGTATTGTHTRYNNVVDLGIYGGIFGHNQKTAGEALFQGKFELWYAYQSVSSYQVTNFSNWNNLMGDASLALRTSIPKIVAGEGALSIPVGSTAYTALVTADHIPLAGALVTLQQESGVIPGGACFMALTDENGQVILPLDGSLASGEATLTVSGVNLYPWQQTVQITSEDVYVDVSGWELDDDDADNSSGNDDGLLNPGETIDLRLALGNLGTAETATGITATLTAADPRIVLLQTDTSVPDLAPDSQSDITTQLLFSVASLVEVDLSSSVDLILSINTDQGDFTAAMQVPLVQPLLMSGTVMADGSGDQTIDPDEEAELLLELLNDGDTSFPFSNAVLTCSDPWMEIISAESSYNPVHPGEGAYNLSDFVIHPLAGCFNGQVVPFQLTATSANGPEQQVAIELTVGEMDNEDPIGPAAGIYYCFDSDDEYYSQQPSYAWMEINQVGDQLSLSDYYDEDDDSEVIALPFDFVYFDESYNRVTVCSNGWCAPGDHEGEVNYRNYPIPTGIGPTSMIAPFWDDLRVTTGGGVDGKVFTYYDEPNHRFIIEWFDLTQVGPGSPDETFQAILYDQDFFGTDNGDILFQYLEVDNNQNSSSTDNDYATVGIESPDQTTGLQYSYWNNYTDGATPLRDGLAILFTQERGEYSEVDIWAPEIYHTPISWVAGAGPYPITAQIVDLSGVDSANLHWSFDNESFTVVTMVNSSGDSWTADVPDQDLGTRIYYYMVAVDASPQGNETTSPTNSFIVGEWQFIFVDDMEEGEGDWTHSAPTDWIDQWHLSTEDYQSGTHSWKCGDTEEDDYVSLLDSRLVMPSFTVEPESILRINHRIEAEVSGAYPDSAYDGGIVEISLDGSQWDLLLAQTGSYNKHFRILNGYGEPTTHPFVEGGACFSGEFDWQESTFSLLDYAGETVQIRFRFGSDEGTVREGWYIDDVSVEHFFPAESVTDNPGQQLPDRCELAQNYPNPFNPTTTIEYSLRLDGPVQLAVFNLRGQQVMTLVDDFKAAGRHSVQLDGSRLASGLYFYKLDAEGTALTRKMMLVK